MTRILLAALLAFSASVFAQSPDDSDPRLRAAEADGAAIYRLDHAAAVATDAAQRLKAFRRDKRVSGWLTGEADGAVVVTFYGNDDAGTPQALYRVAVSAGGASDAQALKPGIPLTEQQAAQAAARSLALHSKFDACSKNYNTVVLPRSDGTWTVYLLAGTTKAGVVPAGGNYRVDVDPTGKSIMASRGFTKSCIELANDKRTAALMLTHLLDPVPTEIHVFLSLLAGKPMYLLTVKNASMWSIENGKIRFVQKIEPKN